MNRINRIERNLERADNYEEYMKILEILAQEEIKEEFGKCLFPHNPYSKISQRFVYTSSDQRIDNKIEPKWITRYYVR